MRFVLVPFAGYVLLYAPGHALLRRTARLDGETSRLFGEVLLSTCCTSWVGLLLAELGVFSLALLMAILGTVALVASFLRGGDRRAEYGRRDAFGVALCLLTCVWLAPPFDTRLAASDSSGYLAGGLHLARHGTLVMHDATLPRLSVDLKRALFPSVAPERGAPPYLRLSGSLILRSLDSDEVLVAFHHSISVWVAIADSAAGPDAGAWSITLFGGLSVWAMVECATLLGAPAGLVLPLLLLSAIQYWYSRFLMPEVPGQYFLWAGLACVAAHERTTRASDAVLAGLAFGLAGLLRFENAVFLVAAMSIVAPTVPARLRRHYALLLGCAILLWLHAGIHLALFRTHYFGILRSLLTFGSDRRDLGALLIALVAALLAARWYRVRRLRWGPPLHAGLLVCLLLLSLWGGYRSGWSSLRLLTSAIGVPTLLGGGIGLLLLLRHRDTSAAPAARLLVMLAALAWAQVILAPHAQPVPIWTVRRALTIVLPAAGVGMALLCHTAARRWHWTVAAVLCCVALAGEARLFWQLRAEPDYYRYAGRHIDALAALIEPGATVLVDGQLVALALAPALWAAHDLPAYLLATADAEHIGELVSAMDGTPVYWLCSGVQPLPHGPGFELTPVALYEFTITTPQLDVGSPLGAAANWQTPLALYRVRVDAPAAQKKTPLRASRSGAG